MKKSIYILILLMVFYNTYGQEILSGNRDPWLWPYSQNSIWNQPIGSNAIYVDANLEPAKYADYDIQHIMELSSSYPEQQVLGTEVWGPGRCDGTSYLGFTLRVPDDWIVPDAVNNNWTPNNNFAFRLPDSDMVFEGSLVSRCVAAGPVYLPSWMSSPSNRRYQSIKGEGLDGGGQGASGMSALGGTIRKGEFSSDNPIRHAIKINPWAAKYCYYNDAIPGYKWPARSADNYAPNVYGGNNPNIVMGSLLAIPPDVTPESIGIQTDAGKKLFFTMQNYGVYFAEDGYGDYWGIIVEKGVEDEFEDTFGFSMTSDTWSNDVNRLMTALSVIINNSPDNIGGGGTPRQPLAPVFSNVTKHYISDTICSGEFVQIDNSIFTESGTYTVCLSNKSECDSVIILDLTVNQSQNIYITKTISQGESVQIGTDVFSESGSYSSKLMNQFGCDSIVNLDLIVISSQETYIEKSICQGEIFQIGNNNFSESGKYIIKLKNQSGGDSIVNLDLTVNPIYNITDKLNINENELPYNYYDQIIPITAASGEIKFFLKTVLGCDSIVTLDLTINKVPDTNLSDSVIKINLGEPSKITGWNDLELNRSDISNLKYSDETSSSYNFSMWNGWTSYNRGDVSGSCYHENIVGNYIYTSDNSIRNFTLSNLNSTKVYDIDILSSRNRRTSEEIGAVFIVGEHVDSINAKGNTCELVSFKNISPQNNEIKIGYRKRFNDLYGVVNAVIITEKKSYDETSNPSNDSTKSGSTTNTFPIIIADYNESVNSGTVNILDASKSFDPDNDELNFNWIGPEGVSLSNTNSSKISYLVPDVSYPTTRRFKVEVSDAKGISYKSIDITFTPYKPDVSKLQVSSIEASHFDGNNHPVNILDDNPDTYWSAKGDNHWVKMELNAPADISHLKLAFYGMNEKYSNFDVYLSQDNNTWEPLFEELSSCGFSNDKHLVECANYKSTILYKFVKIIGHGNNIDDNNTISELEVFGDVTSSAYFIKEEQQVLKVYPNPATQYFTIDLHEEGNVSLFDIAGTKIFQKYFEKGIHRLNADFPKGCYVITFQTKKHISVKQKLIIK